MLHSVLFEGIFLSILNEQARSTPRHDILLDKLSYYGVTHQAKTPIECYLSNRKQLIVQVGNIKSTMKLVSTIEFHKVRLLVFPFLILLSMT